MSAMVFQLVCIPLARYTDHKSEVSTDAGLDSGDGILDDNGPYRFNLKQLCRDQKRVRGGLPGKTLRIDRVASFTALSTVVQF